MRQSELQAFFTNFQQNIVWRRVGTFKFPTPSPPCLDHPHPLMRSFLKLIPSCSPSACLLALVESPELAEASNGGRLGRARNHTWHRHLIVDAARRPAVKEQSVRPGTAGSHEVARGTPP